MVLQAVADIPAETGQAPTPPKHVAIIMDGNGRWAARSGVSRSRGHRKGADAVKEAIEGAIINNVQYLTLYAFSSENWNRPEDEVTDLMGLLKMYLKKEIRTLNKEGVCLKVIGCRDTLSPDILKLIDKAEALTKSNTRITLVIALSYGSRDEITLAVKEIASKVGLGTLKPNDISEKTIEEHLFTSKIPDPDLLIRTSGEQRLSNFLLWQSAYTEFLFLPVLWPDFTQQTFTDAVLEFQSRDRRYGARP
ncbi:isoprenyl transferase [Kordiimonas aquimaris]|uniref:isoprenyl transferase n=1 Tax=Kordiimonas aquimaris TaxID=707591 RepID=UPI0021D0E6EB|nr:isoprenyl transferase [Kordiimonas aquimaris]